MSRRGKFILVAALAFAGMAWWVDRQLEPHRLTALVLEKAGSSLGLQLSYQGEPDYAFRPEPRLLVPNLLVRDPATGKQILSAKRADISLPWATITGGEPVITRIELDTPSLDLPALRAWLAAQPPTPFKLPTLLKGVHLRDGTIVDEGFRLTTLELDLPRLHATVPAAATASGRFTDGETAFDFDAAIKLKTPGPASDFSLQANGSLQHSPKPLAFKLDTDGHYQSDATGFSVTMASLALEGDSPLPNLHGKSQALIAEPMRVSFDGVLRDWPKDWPSLPAPVSEKATDFVLRLSYQGASDLTGPIQLHLEKDATLIDANLKLQDIQAWTAATDGTPLPPLAATVKTPRIDLDGIRLEGVEVELHPDAPASKSP
jgi:hypothetical protein